MTEKLPSTPKVKPNPLPFDTYISVIKNSVGSNMFRNLFIDLEGKKIDATEDGNLSCAFFVSAVLHMFGYIKGIHATVNGTLKDMKESGWVVIDKPVVGSVILWGESLDSSGHRHVGFYVGEGKTISNNSKSKVPVEHDLDFEGKRKIEEILWKQGIGGRVFV